jgi:hypothetical protein
MLHTRVSELCKKVIEQEMVMEYDREMGHPENRRLLSTQHIYPVFIDHLNGALERLMEDLKLANMTAISKEIIHK